MRPGYAPPERRDGSDRDRPDNTYGLLVSIAPGFLRIPPPPVSPAPRLLTAACLSPGQGSSLMRDTSFLTSRVIPIFPAESYHRSSSAKSDDGSPTVDLSQLNFVTCARRNIRSTTSLLRLSPIKFHSQGKIDRPSTRRASTIPRHLPRLPPPAIGWRSDFSYAKRTFFRLENRRTRDITRVTNSAIVYISNFVLFANGVRAAYSWHSPNHFVISLFESFRSECIFSSKTK